MITKWLFEAWIMTAQVIATLHVKLSSPGATQRCQEFFIKLKV